MKKWEVTWRFDSGLEMARTSIVVAKNAAHAKERIWMLHVEASQLRNKIVFLKVEEVI